MPISIFENIEKKDIPEWKEIFIGYNPKEENDYPSSNSTSCPEGLKTEITEILPNIQKIKNQILKNVLQEGFFQFDPLKFLESDLFGRFSMKKIPHQKFWVSEKDSVSEREAELMKFLFEELYLLTKNNKGKLDEETIGMVLSFLASEGKIDELKEFHISHFHSKAVSEKLRAMLYLTGNLEDINLEEFENENVLSMLCKYKKSHLSYSEEDALYDLAVSMTTPCVLGVVYNLFSQKISGLRNALPIFQIVLKDFDSLSIDEKKLFIGDFLRTGFYFKSYFLMKKVHSKEEIKQWLDNLISSSGKRNQNSTQDGKQEKITLSRKYEMLKNQGLLYTLSPFEILTLLNSQVGENVKEDIFSAESRLSGSYLIQRSCSVIYFFEEDYEAFFQAQSKSGRLRFGVESLYLKAMALKECGLTDEGNEILIALEKKFPDSNLLKSAMENHRI